MTEANLEKYLGKEKVTFEDANQEDQVGIVRGLAWTSVGGDTLQIEVNVMPGDGKLQMTGQMGDVMKESAQIAIRPMCALSAKNMRSPGIILRPMTSICIFRRELFPRTAPPPASPWPRPCCRQ